MLSVAYFVTSCLSPVSADGSVLSVSKSFVITKRVSQEPGTFPNTFQTIPAPRYTHDPAPPEPISLHVNQLQIKSTSRAKLRQTARNRAKSRLLHYLTLRPPGFGGQAGEGKQKGCPERVPLDSTPR